MGWLLLICAGAFPRLAVLYMWLTRRRLFLQAFGGAWIWPLLGGLFLPFTTLTWAQLRKSNKHGHGLLLVPAMLIDLSRLGGSSLTNVHRTATTELSVRAFRTR
jgi:hypothetical protein